MAHFTSSGVGAMRCSFRHVSLYPANGLGAFRRHISSTASSSYKGTPRWGYSDRGRSGNHFHYRSSAPLPLRVSASAQVSVRWQSSVATYQNSVKGGNPDRQGGIPSDRHPRRTPVLARKIVTERSLRTIRARLLCTGDVFPAATRYRLQPFHPSPLCVQGEPNRGHRVYSCWAAAL